MYKMGKWLIGINCGEIGMSLCIELEAVLKIVEPDCSVGRTVFGDREDKKAVPLDRARRRCENAAETLVDVVWRIGELLPQLYDVRIKSPTYVFLGRKPVIVAKAVLEGICGKDYKPYERVDVYAREDGRFSIRQCRDVPMTEAELETALCGRKSNSRSNWNWRELPGCAVLREMEARGQLRYRV